MAGGRGSTGERGEAGYPEIGGGEAHHLQDRRALDELFNHTSQFRSVEAYVDLLRFVTRFRNYSPFNAMLVAAQMSGARYVAPPWRWLSDHQRIIKPGGRPLVILQPMGPVMFVFDVSDTEPLPDAPELPPAILNPFSVRGRRVGSEWSRTIENAKRDGILIEEEHAGSQSAGSIRGVPPTGVPLLFQVRSRPEPEYARIPRRYTVLINRSHTRETQYATLVHELAHLYCGHLGTPNPGWWPDRRSLPQAVEEFEAESVSYLVCRRLGIQTPSAAYLAGHLEAGGNVPSISLECVMKAAGLIEQMGLATLKLRKTK